MGIEEVQQSGMGGDCWKIIGVMGAVIAALAGYIMKLHVEIGKGKDDRIADLKELAKPVKKEG